MVALSVNINKIALIRNSRPGNNPDLIDYAKRCVAYGAKGITVHPRPDQRHIRAEDCYALSQANLGVEFNIEGNPFADTYPSNDDAASDYPGFMTLVLAIKPDQCTLVPDSHTQKTSDHGFNLTADTQALEEIIDQLKTAGIRVSLFMDPDCEQISRAKAIGADRIELYTGPYAEADNQEASFNLYKIAAEHALSCGLGINAGHDLNLSNIERFSALPGLQEVSIGHALTIESLENGLRPTIEAYNRKLGA